jgi:hypothetical protein
MQGDVVMGGGTLGGSGTLNGNLVVSNGNFAPGFSPGAITVNGALTLNATSVLTIELGGAAQGSGYDFINVTGLATLAGTLNVVPYAGYVAAPGATFTFMKFAASTGSFAAVNLPAGWNLSYLTGVADLALLAPAVNAALANNTLLALVATTAPALAPESVVQTFERVAGGLETFGLPVQTLVSVDKPIAEEACP